METLIPAERIEQRIYLMRGQKVMLDRDLAVLYGVPTKVFNQAVKRHRKRFPEDFMFQMNAAELKNWRSQIVTSNFMAQMGLRRCPYVFTEQGVAMLSSVLNSERAIWVNIAIIRAFVQLRAAMATNKGLARNLEKLEQRIKSHGAAILSIFEAIKEFREQPEKGRRQIGFQP